MLSRFARRAPAGAPSPVVAPAKTNIPTLLVVAGLMNCGWDLVTPFVPLMVLELQGGDPRSAAVWAGLAFSISPFLSAIAGPVWGAYAERHGARLAMMRTIATSCVMVTMMAGVWALWQFIALRGLVGILGGFYVLVHNLAARASTRDRVGQTIGSLQTVSMVLLAVVPPVAGLLVDLWGLRTNFLIATAVMLVALVVMWTRYRDELDPSHEAPGGQKSKGNYWTVLREPGLAVIAAVIFASQFADRTFMALAPLLVVEVAPDPDKVGFYTGLMMGVSAGSSAIGAFICGWLSRRYSPRILLGFALSLGVVFLFLVASSESLGGLIAWRVVYGITGGGALPLAYALAGRLVAAHRMASAFSMFASCAMIGSAAGPLSLGFSTAFDLRAPLYVGVAMVGVSILLIVQRPGWRVPWAVPTATKAGDPTG
jgi:DHA1 family multidrug resistance protein-like MFS transporter